MRERIESHANRKIKLAASLHARRGREKANCFLVEGLRLAEMAAESHWQTEYALFTQAFAQKARGARLLERLEARCPLYEVDEGCFKKVAATDSPQGIALVMRAQHQSLDAHSVRRKESLYIVLDGVQDPGNVGTIIRTADAAGADGVICLCGTADLFGDKTMRSTMGSLFHLPIFTEVTTEALMEFCTAHGIALCAAALDPAAKPLFDPLFQRACAIVLGNEGNGISETILQEAAHVFIPMYGRAESLNVATSAAILLYEAVRQRNYNHSAQQR
ncbi:MAG: TrmH family RNA methyltransferase [Mitsuokella sp.]